ncbi:hypothetical protein KBB27_03070 [Patescibacteria group bacterium]|nr:hypothetical protein [Patescibacteria group bacterium]
MILIQLVFVLLGVFLPLNVYAIPSPDVLGPIISIMTAFLGLVSVGASVLIAWLIRISRVVRFKDRRKALIALFSLGVVIVAAIAWFMISPFSTAPTTVLSPQRLTATENNLLSSRVASSTILIPTFILKEVVKEPNWDKRTLLLDIREQEEREVGIVDASTTWIRYGDLIHGGVDTLPRDRDILVICWTSLRGSETVQWLREHGIVRSFAIEGGLQGVLEPNGHGWIPDGLPWKGDTKWSTTFRTFEYPQQGELKNIKQRYDQGAFVIDVRDPERFEQGYIKGAWSLPLQTAPTSLVNETLQRLSTTSTSIVIYADGYVDTFYAKVLGLRLLKLGYERTILFLDTNHTWEKAGYPIDSSSSAAKTVR